MVFMNHIRNGAEIAMMRHINHQHRPS